MPTLERLVKRVILRPCIEVFARRPSPRLLELIRWAAGIQLSADELRRVTEAVARRPGCRLLVFGLGNDTLLWTRVNRAGTTVFIEDNAHWLRKVRARYRAVTAHLVAYGTRRPEWRTLLETPERLAMRLPEEVERERWDVILVDGPAGFNDSDPGRMKSIALARRLAGAGTDIFVHDCHRPVEQAYCDRFLKPENLVEEVGLIRHYRLEADGGDPPA